VVQVQLDPEKDSIRLQPLPIESSYLAEFSEKSDKINLLCRCGRVRKSRRRHQSLLCPYLAEISSSRQYQSVVQVQLDPEEDPIQLQPLPIELSYLAEFSENQIKSIF
jgi:hypothetical protein